MDTSEKKYSIRLIKPDDPERITDFLISIYGKWPSFDINCSPVEFWKWKHLDNPRGPSLVSLCEKDNEIIGVTHSSIIKIILGDQIITTGQSADLAVHPDHRLKGIRTKLVKHMFSHFDEYGIQLNIAVTGNPYLIKSMQRKNRPKFPHEISHYVRIVDIDRHLENMPMDREWLIKTGFRAITFLNAIKNQIKNIENVNDLTFEQVEEFDERMDDFWSTLSMNYDFILTRDRDYLNWRYCDKRAGNFRITLATKNTKVLGYIISRINSINPEYPVGFIIDLQTLPDSIEIANNLIQKEVEYLENKGINIILSLVLDGHPHEKILSYNGFVDSQINYQAYLVPAGGYVEYTEKPSEEYIKIKNYSPERIYYSWGDHDSLPTSMEKP